jgi:Na+/H+ antiporter NhaC
MGKQNQLTFKIGPFGSFMPFLVFIITALITVIFGAPTMEGMVICSLIGLIVGMFIAEDRYLYNEMIFEGMAQKIGVVAVVCWIFAGIFGQILKLSGLVEAMVWVGATLKLSGGLFTAITFLASATFAVAVGSGLGTIIAFTSVMYPAGIILGANPAVLAGAILSGGAFGDNLAPISDTTIVSATSQDTDVPGVVRSRFKYAAIAGGLALILFALTGGGRAVLDPAQATELLAKHANPKGLPMLIPPVIVVITALRGRHFIESLSWGIIIALIMGPLLGTFSLSEVLRVENGAVVGAAIDGAVGMFGVSVLAMLLTTCAYIMQKGGFMDLALKWIMQSVAKTVSLAELAIIGLTSLINICLSVNTVAIIASAPFTKTIGEAFKIDPRRRANLMDCISCSFPYILPWANTILSITVTMKSVKSSYPFVPVLPWVNLAPFMYYGIILFLLMIVAALTGFGREERIPIISSEKMSK